MSKPKDGTVILSYEPLTPQVLTKMAKVLPKNAVIDTDLARLAGAHFAFGTPDAIEDLKRRLSGHALAEVRLKHPDMSEAAHRWLSNGEQGLSSKAIFHHTVAPICKEQDKDCHPHDLADFRRCCLLLHDVPETRAGFAKMAKVSDTWARLVAHWNQIETLMIDDCLHWRISLTNGDAAQKMLFDVLKKE